MSEVLLSDIVTGSIDGDGIFDKLMQSIDIRLDQQFRKQRITGSDYASVYLGAMQTALQQSIAFALGKQQADKQADLIVAQTLQAGAQTALTEEQAKLVTEQVEVAKEQFDKITSEIALLNQKKVTEESQTVDVDASGNPIAGVVGKQKELYTKQAEGFERDAENKAMKAFTDIWTIAKTQDPDGVATALPHNADQASMDVMLEKIAAGIGVTKTDLNV